MAPALERKMEGAGGNGAAMTTGDPGYAWESSHLGC